ncbi:MAG: hypothetical protein QM813_14385 [Verrucomicrobiota bacterium]
MNPHDDKQLEVRIQQELDALGELSAPPALANRIMQRIAARSTAPWYRRAWPTWPLGLRFASLALLLGVFGGLCLGAWELTHTVSMLEHTSRWFADAQALWRTVGVLGNVISTFTERLGTGVIVTSLALLFAACAACIGLGSACFRLALRPTHNRI